MTEGNPPDRPAGLDIDDVKRLLQRGQELAIAGELEEAEGVLREALALTRGDGGPAESRACGNLGTFYGIHNRGFEAILLYRRGLAIDRARGDWRLVVHHLANVAGICAMLDMDERLPDLVGEIDQALDHLESDARAGAERIALWPRFLSALWVGNLAGARDLLERIREAYGGFNEPRVRANVALLQARLHTQAGVHVEALAALHEAEAVDELTTTCQLDLLVEQIRALDALGRGDEALATATRALDLLEGARGEAPMAEQCIAIGSLLATHFEQGDCPADLARRAYDIAASAILERIRQLDRCLRDLPELLDVTAEDHAWFGELRESFARKQSALLHRVGELLDEARSAGDFPIFDASSDDDLIRLCAWCCTVRTREGRWIPVAHFIPVEAGARVTHSICETCAERVRRGR